MSLILALLLGTDPPLADLDRFPSHDACTSQLLRYEIHAKYLLRQRCLRGWEGGRWHWWMRENARGLRCWELLAAAGEDGPPGPRPGGGFNGFTWTDATRRGYLRQYRDLVGEAAYYAGWRPQMYPEPPPPQMMPGANATNNSKNP